VTLTCDPGGKRKGTWGNPLSGPITASGDVISGFEKKKKKGRRGRRPIREKEGASQRIDHDQGLRVPPKGEKRLITQD